MTAEELKDAIVRSLIYNRLTYEGRLLYHAIDFTRGSGDFPFSTGLSWAMQDYATRSCQPSDKNAKWGNGFRNRREVFVVPLAENACEFLRGSDCDLDGLDLPANALFEWFRKRWLLPRAERDQTYRAFNPESWRLWGRKEVLP
jgi:hypothetical protein